MYKFLLFSYFLCFLVSITILSYTLILPVSQLQAQQLMTSQIRSHAEYLIQIYNILVLIFTKLDAKSSLTDGFEYDFIMIIGDGLLLCGHPVYAGDCMRRVFRIRTVTSMQHTNCKCQIFFDAVSNSEAQLKSTQFRWVLDLTRPFTYTGWPKKVSQSRFYEESSLNRIKNRQCGYISHQL